MAVIRTTRFEVAPADVEEMVARRNALVMHSAVAADDHPAVAATALPAIRRTSRTEG